MHDRRLGILATAATLLLLGSPANAQTDGPRALALVGVNVIDVEGGTVVPDQRIIVQGDRIVAIGSSGSTPIPRGAQVLRAPGRYVIPGLWDMHVHQAQGPWIDDTEKREDAIRLTLTHFRTLFLAAGVTGVRDMSGDLRVLRAADSAWRAEGTPAPRMVVTGRKLGMRPVVPGAPHPLRTPADVRQAVRMLRAAGAHHVKFEDVPLALTPVVLDACREAGLPCVGELPMTAPAAEFIRLGVASVEHLFSLPANTAERSLAELMAQKKEYEHPSLLHRVLYKLRLRTRPGNPEDSALWGHVPDRGRALFREAAERGTYFTPTMLVSDLVNGFLHPIHAIARDTGLMLWRAPARRPGARLEQEEVDRRRRRHALELLLVREMQASGVHILAGSDTPLRTVPGYALHAELEMLQRAGLTPLEALRTATLEPARYLGATDTLGAVKVGRVADLVVLRANPLEDVRHVAQIDAVVVRGHLLQRPELSALKIEAKRALDQLRARMRP